MNNEKYLGIISDSSNHMNPYLRFSKTCLPLLNSQENTFEKGDIVSKLKKSTDLILLKDNKKMVYARINLIFFRHIDEKE